MRTFSTQAGWWSVVQTPVRTGTRCRMLVNALNLRRQVRLPQNEDSRGSEVRGQELDDRRHVLGDRGQRPGGCCESERAAAAE